jgi:hypothetical protein
MDKKKLLSGKDFDLIITDASTNEQYVGDDTWIPKNASVVVKRVPKENALLTRFGRASTRPNATVDATISLNKAEDDNEDDQEGEDDEEEDGGGAVCVVQDDDDDDDDDDDEEDGDGPPKLSEEEEMRMLMSQTRKFQTTGVQVSRGPGMSGVPGHQQPKIAGGAGGGAPGAGPDRAVTGGAGGAGGKPWTNFAALKEERVEKVPGVPLVNITQGAEKDGLQLLESVAGPADSVRSAVGREFTSKDIDLTQVPDYLKCPLSGNILDDAVLLPCCQRR